MPPEQQPSSNYQPNLPQPVVPQVPQPPTQPPQSPQQPSSQKPRKGLVVGLVIAGTIVLLSIISIIVVDSIQYYSDVQEKAQQAAKSAKEREKDNQQEGTTGQSEPTKEDSSKCFASDDYSKALGWKNTIVFTNTSPFTTNVHFEPDSLEYTNPVGNQTIRTVARIVKNNPGKDYTIALSGSVATTNAGDKEFALQRANKVRDELVSLGVLVDNIRVDDPKDISAMGDDSNNETVKQSSRSVVLNFYPACSEES